MNSGMNAPRWIFWIASLLEWSMEYVEVKSNLKKLMRAIAHKTVLRPPYVRYCSQTIYESLLGCMRMFEATGESKWKQRADRLLSILLRIQQPDGGFDIGYDFNFGLTHKKGQSTSPELVALVALAEYGRLFGKDKILDSAHRAAEWIRSNALDMGGGRYAIPYSPYTVREVMVYNGGSFAAGALGCYLGYVREDDELHRIYRGIVSYLNSVMSEDRELGGRCWYYSDQSRTDMTQMQREKIDYYHQMQQVEVHSLAQQACGVEGQLDMIIDAADLIVALQKKHGVVPYTNSDVYFGGKIHLWGLSSVASGLLEAAMVAPERKEVYYEVARKVLGWFIMNGWTGKYFAPVVDRDGTIIFRDYLVRSDAWIFNALSAGCKYLGDGPWRKLAEDCFIRMESANFSGPESHASTRSRRIIRAMGRKVLGFIR